MSLSSPKRNIVDLDDNTFNTLSCMAVEKGTNLKNYIEELLSDIAGNYKDAKIYTKLSDERPDGKIVLYEQEKADFVKWLGM